MTNVISDNVFNSILSLVGNSVVFLDESAAECIHWQQDGFEKLSSGAGGAGALQIRSISDTMKDCLESETKGVFIISSGINGKVSSQIEEIVKSNDFHQCTVISSMSANLHELTSSSASGHHYPTTFGSFSKHLRIWMGNDYATADVRHIPLFHAQVLSDFFITPPYNDLFPLLPSDVARLQAFLHSKGDRRLFDHLGDIDFSILPKNLQVKIKALASSLSDMFEISSINEDCYGVGHFSKIIASELANLPDAKARRKSATKRASIVFVDRILDLVGPSSFTSENLLDLIMEVLFKLKGHHNDVAINMELLFSNGNKNMDTILPGCLAHTSDPIVMEVLNSFTMEQCNEAIKIIQSKIIDVLKKEKIDFQPIEDIPFQQRIKHLLKYFRGNIKLFQKYGGLLQCAVAVVNTFNDLDKLHRDELLSAEKVMMLELSNDGSSSVLSKILSLLNKDSERCSIIDALLLCLHFYSAVGQSFDPGLEEKLKAAMTGIIMDGNHEDDLLFLFGDYGPSERQVRLKIADIFERLNGIAKARNEQKQIRSLLSKSSTGEMKYDSLLSQLMAMIYDPCKPDLIDVEFRSHGLKDFFKTGFGLFMNVTKPRPDEHNLLYLFVVGGITFNEVCQVRKIVKKLNPSAQVIIGSTRIISPTDVLEQVLCTDNLFVNFE
eukprot:gene16691-18385_t